VYLRASPKIYANKITTRFLITHGEIDGAVPFNQSLSLFYVMAELRKKVWLLGYEKEDHGLSDPANKLDYTIRAKQFFDHYLIGKPAPRCMTTGIPYRLKQVDDGYSYDISSAQ
jgi:dipeptidyl aminopeptidase/acylaminoacyl peptidase